MIKKCRKCKKLKEHQAKGLCANCYQKINKIKESRRKWYKNNPKKCKIYAKRNTIRCRNNNLTKRFGFIPKIYLYNKDVTSDGCFMGNSRCLKHYRASPACSTNKKNFKMMWLYKFDSEFGDSYKIQIVNVIKNEEFWFRFNKSYEEVLKIFNKFKSYPVNAMKNLK